MDKLNFIAPHKGESTGKDIRSAYSADGSYVKDFPQPSNVGELMEILAQLPKSLPLFTSECAKLTWFNVAASKHADEHLAIEELDDCDEEDDEPLDDDSDWEDEDWEDEDD